MSQSEQPSKWPPSRRRTLALAGGAALLAGAAFLMGRETDRAQGSAQIVATTSQAGDLVARLAGDRFTSATLMGPGVDPHLYQPTRQDTIRLLGARLVVANGLLLEGQMGESLARIAGPNRTLLTLGERVPQDRLIVPPAGSDLAEKPYDPHFWFDVALWKAAAGLVAASLTDLDPDQGETIGAARAAFEAEADELDAYGREVMATVPEAARVLVTAHDAFAYFGRAYGLAVEGIQGISTESEAGLERVARLVDLIVTRRIPALFVETSVSDRNLQALIEGARARGHEVRIGGSLFSDAMGDPGSYTGTWVGMMDHNLTVVARALGGTAPERGRWGRLPLG